MRFLTSGFLHNSEENGQVICDKKNLHGIQVDKFVTLHLGKFAAQLETTYQSSHGTTVL